MEKKKGYLVLEVVYKYNDEYYHTGDYGVTYEAPENIYLSKEKAEAVLKQKTFEKLREEDLGRYGGYGLESICKKDKIGQFERVMMEEFEINTDDYDLEIPNTATDEQLEKVLEYLDLEFFKLVEVEVE